MTTTSKPSDKPTDPGGTSSAIPGDTPLVLALTHAEFSEKLLDVYLFGFGSGYLSGLVKVGVHPAQAVARADAMAEAIRADPLARNAASDSAAARFHDDVSLLPPVRRLRVGGHGPGCDGTCNDHGQDQDGRS